MAPDLILQTVIVGVAAIMLIMWLILLSRDSRQEVIPERRKEDAMWRTEYHDPLELEFQIFLATISTEKDDFRSALKLWEDYVEEKSNLKE